MRVVPGISLGPAVCVQGRGLVGVGHGHTAVWPVGFGQCCRVKWVSALSRPVHVSSSLTLSLCSEPSQGLPHLE